MPSIADLVKQKDAVYKKIHRFAVYPGVDHFLDLLEKKKIPRAIVTAGLRDRLNDTVPKASL